MNRKELENKLAELKSDYIRIQEDFEKVVFVGGREAVTEEQLIKVEKEIAEVNKQLDELDEE